MLIEEFLFPYNPAKHCVARLIESRNLAGLEWLRQKKIEYPTQDKLLLAFSIGDLDVIHYLFYTYQEMFTQEIFNVAASTCSPAVLSFLEDRIPYQDMRLDETTINHIIAKDDVFLLRYFHQRYPNALPEYRESALETACLFADLEMVQFLVEEKHVTIPAKAMDYAAMAGKVHVVSYLHSLAAPCSTDAMDFAAAYGHLDVVEFLHQTRTEGCTTLAVDSAAAHGHESIVRFLLKFRMEGGTTEALRHTLMLQNYELAKFLLEKGIPLGPLPEYLIDCGYVEQLKFVIHQAGNLHPHDLMVYAAENGSKESMAVLMQRFPGHLTTDLLIDVTRLGKLECWVQLFEAFPFHEMNDMAIEVAANNRMELMRFLHRNKCSCPFETMVEAAANGHLEMMEYLAVACHSVYSNVDWLQDAIDMAMMNGHVRVYHWLKHRYQCGDWSPAGHWDESQQFTYESDELLAEYLI